MRYRQSKGPVEPDSEPEWVALQPEEDEKDRGPPTFGTSARLAATTGSNVQTDTNVNTGTNTGRPRKNRDHGSIAETGISSTPDVESHQLVQSASSTISAGILRSLTSTFPLGTWAADEKRFDKPQAKFSRVADPEIVTAVGSGLPLYDAKNLATSVIYWPENNSKGELEEESFRTAETDSTPKPSASLGELHLGSTLPMTEYTPSSQALREYLSSKERIKHWVHSRVEPPDQFYSPNAAPSDLQDPEFVLSPASDAGSAHSVPPKMILRYSDGRPDQPIYDDPNAPPLKRGGSKLRPRKSLRSQTLLASNRSRSGSQGAPRVPEEIRFLPSHPVDTPRSAAHSHTRVANPEITAVGSGPPLYDARNVATSVIYWPENNSKGELEEESFRTAETDSTPKPSASLGELHKYLPNGGTILSFHQPATTLSWLEENYDAPLVRLVHNSNVFSGPLSMMLFPDTPALAIFGPVNWEKTGELAQELANKSNFPVITRPSAYDPVSRFKSLVSLHGIETGDTHGRETSATDDTTASQPGGGARSEMIFGSDRGGDGMGGEDSGQGDLIRGASDENGDPSVPGNGDPNAGNDEADPAVLQAGTNRDIKGKKKFNGDAGGDPGGDGTATGTEADDKWEDWVSPCHTTAFDIDLQVNSERSVHLEIGSQTQFKTFADESVPLDDNKEWSQQDLTRSQVQVHTKLKIQFPGREILLDRSYAFLGFLAHRPHSISRKDNLECGFSVPTRTYKRINATNVQNTLSSSIGVAGRIPALTAGLGYTRGQSKTITLEAADAKPMPPYHVTPDPGEGYSDKNGKCFRSYAYSYTPNALWPGDQPRPDVGFALGINFFPPRNEQEKSAAPPQVENIIRSQIFMWVPDSSLRSKIRGVVFVLSNNVRDIRRRWSIVETEEVKIDLATGHHVVGTAGPRGDEEDGGFALSAIPVDQKKYRPELEPDSTKKPSALQTVQAPVKKWLKSKPVAPQVTLATHELISRGWDATNSQWRDPIYPELDKYFRVPTATDPSPVRGERVGIHWELRRGNCRMWHKQRCSTKIVPISCGLAPDYCKTFRG